MPEPEETPAAAPARHRLEPLTITFLWRWKKRASVASFSATFSADIDASYGTTSLPS